MIILKLLAGVVLFSIGHIGVRLLEALFEH